MNSSETDSLYRVKNWDINFEGAKSKTYNNKTSCSMPTKHGLGYRKIVRSENGAAIFGAWCALIQVLSRHEKPRQGYCTDTGGILGNPYTPEDLEIITDIDACLFYSLFEMAQVVGWIELVNSKDTTGIPQGYHRDIKYPLNSDLDSNLDSDLNYNSNSKEAVDWRLKHPEYEKIKNCEPLKKITPERYIAIKHAFPKVIADGVVTMACLKATSPDADIKNQDGFLRTQFQYAKEADPADLPYALGGKCFRKDEDGSLNADDVAAFRKTVL